MKKEQLCHCEPRRGEAIYPHPFLPPRNGGG
jgi:hypothetical protein